MSQSWLIKTSEQHTYEGWNNSRQEKTGQNSQTIFTTQTHKPQSEHNPAISILFFLHKTQ